MSIPLIDMIKPKNDGAFPMVEDVDFKGGHRVVADAAERDAIPTASRKAGMTVYTQDDGQTWALDVDLESWYAGAPAPGLTVDDIAGAPGNIPAVNDEGTAFTSGPLSVVSNQLLSSIPFLLPTSSGALKTSDGRVIVNTQGGLAFGNESDVVGFLGSGFYFGRSLLDLVMLFAEAPLGNGCLQIRYPLSGAVQPLQLAGITIDLTGETSFVIQAPDNWYVYYDFVGTPAGPVTLVIDDNNEHGTYNIRNGTTESITAGTSAGTEFTELLPDQSAGFKFDQATDNVYARTGAVGALDLANANAVTGMLPGANVQASSASNAGSMSAADKTKLNAMQPEGVVAVAALAIDWSAGKSFTKTLSAGSNTFTFSNVTAGWDITVRLTGATSTVTWPTVKWAGGVAPTQTSSGVDVYSFWSDGTSIFGSFVQAFA